MDARAKLSSLEAAHLERNKAIPRDNSEVVKATGEWRKFIELHPDIEKEIIRLSNDPKVDTQSSPGLVDFFLFVNKFDDWDKPTLEWLVDKRVALEIALVKQHASMQRFRENAELQNARKTLEELMGG